MCMPAYAGHSHRCEQGQSQERVIRCLRAPLVELDFPSDRTQARAILLEAELIEAAIPRLAEADYSKARRIIEEIDQADGDALLSLNVEFHNVLYAKAARPRTEPIVERLRLTLEPYLRLLWAQTGYQADSQRDHRKLLDLCKKKRTMEARRLLERHIGRTGKQIEALLQIRA